MRLGISTACFYPQPLEDTIPRISSLGFHLIEIFFNTESELRDPFLSALNGSLIPLFSRASNRWPTRMASRLYPSIPIRH